MLTKPAYIGLLVAAFILPYIPIINWPFAWLESYFHEISHGLIGMITGGTIEGIELALNGSGACHIRGGVVVLVAFSGYLGAIGWGMLLYMSSLNDHQLSAKNSLGLLALWIAFSVAWWGLDIITYLIGAVLVSLLLVFRRFQAELWINLILKFCGVYVMVSAVRSPLALIDGKDIGDGAHLAQLTGIPELIWVVIWEVLALLALWVSWRMTVKCQQQQKQNAQGWGFWGRK